LSENAGTKVFKQIFAAVYSSSFVCFAYENQSKLVFFSLKSELKVSQVDIPGKIWTLAILQCLSFV